MLMQITRSLEEQEISLHNMTNVISQNCAPIACIHCSINCVLKCYGY